jgi:hypothetical protein
MYSEAGLILVPKINTDSEVLKISLDSESVLILVLKIIMNSEILVPQITVIDAELFHNI